MSTREARGSCWDRTATARRSRASYASCATPTRHEIRDLNVSTSLYGDFAAAHTDGDQSQVLPTDTQKNTAFAFAKRHGVASPEDYAIALGTRLLEATPAADGAVVQVEEYAWDRIPVNGFGHDHAFVRRGGEVRTAAVEVTSAGPSVTSGLKDLVVLKSTGSEFKGFLRDDYTTLPDADDRILATALRAEWHHRDGARPDWSTTYESVRALLLETFATTYSQGPAGDALRDGSGRARGPRGDRPGSPSRPPTSTTSWSTSSRSGWTTRARSSSRPTAPTG